jgi:N,N'-diacetyllegionaminate synthase
MFSKKKLVLPYVIAEIGSNHNGSLTKAIKLIRLAKKSGSDAVKFQSWNESLYDQKSLNKKELQKIKKLVISYKKLKKLRLYAKSININFGTTVFDNSQIKEATKLKCDFLKIASMDCNNYPLIQKVAETKLPVIISTGFTTVKELKKTIQIVNRSKKKNIYFLHCVSIYPPKYTQLNINNIKLLRRITKKNVGFSDHSIGTLASTVATVVGAKIIEKHFTFNKKARGADHKISADFCEMKKLVADCKSVNDIMGMEERKISFLEHQISLKMRRSIFSKRRITKGEKFSDQNIFIRRPGNGLPPEYLKKIINKKAKKNINMDSIIKLNLVEI